MSKFILTDREEKLLLLIAEGLSHHEITTELHIGYRAVDRLERDLCTRMGAKNTPNLIALAYHRGILTPMTDGIVT